MKKHYEIGEKIKLIHVSLTHKTTGETTPFLDRRFFSILENEEVEEAFDLHVYALTVQMGYYRPLADGKRRYFGKVLKMCSSYFSLNQHEDFANHPVDVTFHFPETDLSPDAIWRPRGLDQSLLPDVVFLTRDYFSQFVGKMNAVNPKVTKHIIDTASAKFDEVHSPSNHFDTLSAQEKIADIRDFTYTTITMLNDALYQQKETVLLRTRLYCYKAVNLPDEIKDVFLDIVSIHLEQSCQPAVARGRYIADDVIYRPKTAQDNHTYFLNAVFFLDKQKLTSMDAFEEIIIKAWIGAIGYSRQEFVDVLEKGWVTLETDLLYATSQRVLQASYEDYSFCIDNTLPFLLHGTSETQQISYSHQVSASLPPAEEPPYLPLGGWDDRRSLTPGTPLGEINAYQKTHR